MCLCRAEKKNVIEYDHVTNKTAHKNKSRENHRGYSRRLHVKQPFIFKNGTNEKLHMLEGNQCISPLGKTYQGESWIRN